MPNVLLSLLSRDWAGLAIAVALGVAGFAVVDAASGALRQMGAVVVVAAGALVLGALRHVLRRAAVRRRYPAPGRMIDIGGYRVHVLAEGPQDGRPPIVWFGGGHASGASMNHLHIGLRGGRRSILIDRPGTGWSDPGPFPRSTARESAEIVAALAASGEQGPFIFVGYSFGGLLVANIARRHPELVSQLVLFDATPLETIVFGPRLGALRQMRADMLGTALLRLFGYSGHLGLRRMAANPGLAALLERTNAVLGEAGVIGQAVDGGTRSELAGWSIFRELSPEGAAACAWETVVYDGDLGDMPVVLVAPGNASEVTAQPEVANAAAAESQRMVRFFAASRERYLAISRRSQRVYTPAGTTHQFVVEAPEFVIELMHRISGVTQ